MMYPLLLLHIIYHYKYLYTLIIHYILYNYYGMTIGFELKRADVRWGTCHWGQVFLKARTILYTVQCIANEYTINIILVMFIVLKLSLIYF